MKNIRILDCTLRDGGYINEWNFGYDNIIKVTEGLNNAHMDIVEIGFLDEKSDYNKSRTLFNNTNQINEILNEVKNINSDIVAMIMYGKCGIENIQDRKDTKINGIRVCFKKKQIDEALEYCKLISNKGYDLYLQPASITDYSDEDIIGLVKKSNSLNVKAFYIVDTYGLMQNEDVLKYYKLIDENLNDGVPIGFHSHNNLQLSFSNAQTLLNLDLNRDLYIDSSVFGMGRGAGNLCSELITQYINQTIEQKYNIIPILELVDECINPIFKEKPWGYSVAYYIASINKCHPNYSTYLVNKQTLGVKDINYLMKQIPEDKMRNYDEKLIFDLYTKYLSHMYNDSDDKQQLKEELANKNVLLIAPGQSIINEKNVIDKYVEDNNPYIISINFIPETINVDALFISNLRRLRETDIDKFDKRILYTSNIDIDNNEGYKFNYSSYLNNKEYISDNATLLLINILRELDLNQIFIAGFDGFSIDRNENYYSDDMKPDFDNKALLKMNEEISEYLNDIDINIKFLTKTYYKKIRR